MPIRVDDVSQKLAILLRADASAAAHGNALVSRAEQARAPSHVDDAAADVRAAGGVGARVSVDDVDTMLRARAAALIASVNQSTGSGKAFLSKAEAQAAAALDPSLGGQVLRAWEITRSGGIDVDGIAKAHAIPAVLEPEERFMKFATESEAERFREPSGLHVKWLVVTGETSTTKSFTSGSNDLWSQRFDVSKLDGSIVITAEH